MSAAITSSAVRSCIQSHYGKPGDQYSCLFEVRDATGFSARRSIDAVVMALWPSLGLELFGMEIKVSRSDWLREIKDPEKASSTFEYFDRWYLVAPADVAKPEEIPQPWGWLVPEGGRLRTAREAAKNSAVRPVDRKFLGALLRKTARQDDVAVEAEIERRNAAMEADFEACIERRIKERLSRVEHLKEEVEAFEAASGIKVSDGWINRPADIGNAVKFVLKAGVTGAFNGIRSQAKHARDYAQRIEEAALEAGLDSPPATVPAHAKRRRS